jgi:hypothetical protein
MEGSSQFFKEFEKNWRKEREEWKAYIDTIYDPSKKQKVDGFLLYASGGLEELCTAEMSDFLFRNNGDDMLIAIDEPSSLRKTMFDEKDLFCSYVYNDHSDSFSSGSARSVDILCRKKEIPRQLKEKLEHLGFFADSIIDFEALEFPHYENESYFGKFSESVSKLYEGLRKKGKEISKEFRRQDSRLYRDTEKFHVIFAAGRKAPGKLEFIPVYIGFGTNEPYGLTFEGKLGKSRFMKWSFDSKDSGFEQGLLKETHITPQDFKKNFSGLSSYEIFWGKDYTLSTLEDEMPHAKYTTFSEVSFDEDRFKGFFKVAGKEINREVLL